MQSDLRLVLTFVTAQCCDYCEQSCEVEAHNDKCALIIAGSNPACRASEAGKGRGGGRASEACGDDADRSDDKRDAVQGSVQPTEAGPGPQGKC